MIKINRELHTLNTFKVDVYNSLLKALNEVNLTGHSMVTDSNKSKKIEKKYEKKIYNMLILYLLYMSDMSRKKAKKFFKIKDKKVSRKRLNDISITEIRESFSIYNNKDINISNNFCILQEMYDRMYIYSTLYLIQNFNNIINHRDVKFISKVNNKIRNLNKILSLIICFTNKIIPIPMPKPYNDPYDINNLYVMLMNIDNKGKSLVPRNIFGTIDFTLIDNKICKTEFLRMSYMIFTGDIKYPKSINKLYTENDIEMKKCLIKFGKEIYTYWTKHNIPPLVSIFMKCYDLNFFNAKKDSKLDKNVTYSLIAIKSLDFMRIFLYRDSKEDKPIKEMVKRAINLLC